MNIDGFDKKIIAGKLVTVPIQRKGGNTPRRTTSLTPWTDFEQPHKIGSKYSIIPPIKDHNHDILSRQISGLQITKAKLDNTSRLLKQLDVGNGTVRSEDLGKVFHLNSIFIIGATFKSLVERFEKDDGIDYKEMCKFLEECSMDSTNYSVHKSKLNGHVVQPRLASNIYRDGSFDEMKSLEVELEKQLAAQPPDLKEFRQTCEKNWRNESISFEEMKQLCQRHKLKLTRSLLERLLTHYSPQGYVNWRDFLELIDKCMPKDGGHSSVDIIHKQPIKKHSDLNTSSIQTQTNNGPDPVYSYVGRQKVYVYPPDEYIGVDIPTEPPDENLVLEWVYGYRGRDCRNNLSVLKSGELVYFIAAVAVILNSKDKKQRHYTEHTDDIKSMAVHPDGITIATGQVEGHDKVQGESHIRVWSSESLITSMVIGLGFFEQAVISLDFCSQPGVDRGRYLVAVDDNNYHTISVWDWEKNKKITNAKGSMDTVLMALFSPFNNKQIVSCGKQHISFWTLDDENKLKCNRGRFDHNVKPKYITCLTFSKDGDVITGDSNGTIFLWPEDNNQISLSVKNAHDGAVYSLYVLPNGMLLSAGGRDGLVRAWDRGLSQMGVQLKFPPSVTGIRTLVTDQHDNLYAGTVNNSIWCTKLASGKSPLLDVSIRLRPIIEGHTDELRGLATHPTAPKFVTAGHDKTIKMWNAAGKDAEWSAKLPVQAQAADFNPKEDIVAIGNKDGSFDVIEVSTGNLLTHKKCAREKISEIKFSPDGVHLAMGSHDNNIYIFKLLDGGQTIDLLGKCEGHTSYVTHLDWSADGNQMQSTSGDYELLFWDALKCERLTSSKDMRNTNWHSQNCVLGFPVLGIWTKEADGTDVNAVDRSHSRRLLATADDFGDVNVFQYPCASIKATPNVAKGHSAHVTCVRFLHDDSRLISVGGRDASVMQWRIST